MKVIDCFIFYNEIDILNYRLNLLNDIVDYFVIVEATHTFSGMQKDLIFKLNSESELFAKFKHKIIHVIDDTILYKYPNIDYNLDQQWKNEEHQRNCIDIGISTIYKNNNQNQNNNQNNNQNDNKNDNDLILISDVDEIPDPLFIRFLINSNININIYSLNMDFYYYNLHCRHTNKWNLPKILSYKFYKYLKSNNYTCEHIRKYHFAEKIDRTGWHLSYFGDVNYIKNKINMFSHQEYNNNHYKNDTNIINNINNGNDLYNRDNIILNKIPLNTNTYLPPLYNTFLHKFIVNE